MEGWGGVALSSLWKLIISLSIPHKERKYIRQKDRKKMYQKENVSAYKYLAALFNQSCQSSKEISETGSEGSVKFSGRFSPFDKKSNEPLKPLKSIFLI